MRNNLKTITKGGPAFLPPTPKGDEWVSAVCL